MYHLPRYVGCKYLGRPPTQRQPRHILVPTRHSRGHYSSVAASLESVAEREACFPSAPSSIGEPFLLGFVPSSFLRRRARPSLAELVMGQGIDCKLVTHAVLEPGLGIVWAAEVGLRRSQSQSPCHTLADHHYQCRRSSKVAGCCWHCCCCWRCCCCCCTTAGERRRRKTCLRDGAVNAPDRFPNCTRSGKSTSTSATSSHLTALVCSSVSHLSPSFPPSGPLIFYLPCPVLS